MENFSLPDGGSFIKNVSTMADIIIISIAVNSNKYPLIPENIDIMLAEIIGPTIPSIEFITPTILL